MPPEEAAQRIVLVLPWSLEASRTSVEALGASLQACAEIDLVLAQQDDAAGRGVSSDSPATRWPDRVRVLNVSQDASRAEALRAGMLLAMGAPGAAYVGVCDTASRVALNALPTLIDSLRQANGTDLLLGTRRPSGWMGERWLEVLIQSLFRIPAQGTRASALLFRVSAESRNLIEQPFQAPRMFQSELVVRYRKSHPKDGGIPALPIDGEECPGAERPPAEIAPSLAETVRLFRAYRVPPRWHALFDLVTAPFARYVGAGAIGTAAHYLILMLLVELFAVKPTIGTMVGATGGALVNYVLNYHLTFASTRSHKEALPRFLAVAAVNVGLAGGIVELANVLGGLHYLIAQVIATVVVILVGFVLNKIWTFAQD